MIERLQRIAENDIESCLTHLAVGEQRTPTGSTQYWEGTTGLSIPSTRGYQDIRHCEGGYSPEV